MDPTVAQVIADQDHTILLGVVLRGIGTAAVLGILGYVASIYRWAGRLEATLELSIQENAAAHAMFGTRLSEHSGRIGTLSMEIARLKGRQNGMGE